jgi:hypothetical protein
MDDKEKQSSSVDQHVIRTTKRRQFLGSLGAVGLASVAGASKVERAEAQLQPPNSSVPQKLSSIANLKVNREQTLDVPNGKESFLEWEASDAVGARTKFIVHTTRIDVDETYTITTSIAAHKFAPGSDPNAEPISTTQQNTTAFGEKGETVGAVRNDVVTVTTVHEDGSSSRETRIIPVRLDLKEFEGLDFAAVASKVGSRYVGN